MEIKVKEITNIKYTEIKTCKQTNNKHLDIITFKQFPAKQNYNIQPIRNY